MPFEFTPVKADPFLKELGIHRDDYQYDFVEISRELVELRRKKFNNKIYELIRAFAPVDLFFLLYFVLDFKEINDPFVLARVYDVQEKNDMVIDLWSRGHFKSSIKTYAYPIWRVLQNQEKRIGIFSNTRNLAIGHMRRIKSTLEHNVLLQRAFPDIFFERPQSKAEKWSEEVGLYVKRKRVYQEATFEAWGLVDFLPTGKHFTDLIYDDIVDSRNVSTQAQTEKATYFFGQSLNLVAQKYSMSISGTRYSLKDTYAEIMKNPKWEVRLFPAEVDEEGKGKRGGYPVMMSREDLDDKFASMGPYIYSSQMLQNPVAEAMQKFNRKWLQFYPFEKKKPVLFYYLIVDPASKKKKESDYTVMMVIGTDGRRNYWLIDMVRDKLNLGERWEKLSKLVKDWGVFDAGYEEYGMQSDIEFMERMMQETSQYFNIIPLGGKVSKEDRIKKLIPDFQRGRWMIPDAIYYERKEDGRIETVELVKSFIEEYENWVPGKAGGHDDMLDCMARIYESKLNVIFPNEISPHEEAVYQHDPLNLSKKTGNGSWMSSG